MSANNFVLIEKTKLGFKITTRDAESDHTNGEYVITDTAEKALIVASKLDSEYGISYKDDTKDI